MNKVYGGTAANSVPSMCETCRAATVVHGRSLNRQFVHCAVLNRNINFPVDSCTHYDDKRTPSRWDMEQIAWVLVTKAAGRAIGFMSPQEFKKHRRAIDDHGPITPEVSPGFCPPDTTEDNG